jgi:hypothetical protein
MAKISAKITAKEQSHIKDVEQNINFYLEAKKIYFDLKVVEVHRGGNQRVLHREVEETLILKPGRSYQVLVRSSRNGDLERYSYGKQHHFFIESAFELHLCCKGNPDIQPFLDDMSHPES